MSKSNRLFELMQILRRHQHPVPGSKLAREAGVSLRTIYRDITALQALGAEIEGEPGVGYVLKPSFLLPPLMFSEEELYALTLGAQWVTRQTDAGLAQAAGNALGKIGAVVPSELRHTMNDNVFHVGRAPAAVKNLDLQMVRHAMREQRKLFIAYRDPKGAETKRIIWPIMLGFVDAQRFVAGWCELRQDYRLFRADRIARTELRSDRYPGRRSDHVKKWRAQVAEETRRSPVKKISRSNV